MIFWSGKGNQAAFSDNGFATSFHLEAVSGTAQMAHLDFRPGGKKRDGTSFGQRCPKLSQVAA